MMWTLVCAALVCAPKNAPDPIPQLLGSLRVGVPVTHENLTVFPLVPATARGRDFTLLDAAIRTGQVAVSEKGSGEVNMVRMRNAGKSHVFGMAGEIVSGAKQDRMLQNDLVLPPESGWLDVPVYCTEHGRWTGTSLEFGTKGQVAAGRVRERASKGRSQQEVWDEVDAARADLGVESPTRAFAKVYDNREVQEQMPVYRARLGRLPETAGGASGVLVALGSEVVCVDVFGSAALFRKMWPKLLESYVIDALTRPGAGSLSRASAAAFLRAAARASVTEEPAVGAGRRWRIRGAQASGSCLTYAMEVVHLDLFPARGPERSGTSLSPAPRLQVRRESSRD